MLRSIDGEARDPADESETNKCGFHLDKYYTIMGIFYRDILFKEKFVSPMTWRIEFD